MNDWWKAPVLQGPENDYGDYDYLIEEIPTSSMKWELSKETWKCDDCGKYSHLTLTATDYFRTLDGYDSISWTTCWKCAIKNRIFNFRFHVKYTIVRKIKVFKTTMDLYRTNPKGGLKKYYKLALKLHR